MLLKLFGYTGGLEITNKTVVGQPVGGLFAVETRGVDPETGRRIFVNNAGKEVEFYYEKSDSHQMAVQEMVQVIAPAINQSSDGKYTWAQGFQQFYGGLDNNLTYKNFDFSLGLTYALGFYTL